MPQELYDLIVKYIRMGYSNEDAELKALAESEKHNPTNIKIERRWCRHPKKKSVVTGQSGNRT